VVCARYQIDNFVKLKPAVDSGDILIGERCYLNSGCVLYAGNGIRIGNDMLMASKCTLAPVNHAFRDPSCLIRDQGFLESRGGILIEDDVWIGTNYILLDGTIIGKGCFDAEGSLIMGKLPQYSIWKGRSASPFEERQ